MLTFEICNQARLTKDPAYDGVFFTGVKSTGIYCRPICGVKKPLTKNVEFFPSAAAAESKGYRPCLRCRPETAPHSPAWNGTKTTVHRALRLIENGALDHNTTEELANRLGVGARHLTRLFQKHLGATPTKVAKTYRVQKAKRLLDQTEHTIKEIAYLSGFACQRRFNTVFRETYGRSPTQIRKSKPVKRGRLS